LSSAQGKNKSVAFIILLIFPYTCSMSFSSYL